jgi:hypothetical protein
MAFKQDAANFQKRHKLMDKNGHKKGAELQKRTTVRPRTTSFVATVQESGAVDYFGFWCEKFIKAYGKKKEDILISTGTE